MNEIDYIRAYKGYREWQKLVYSMIPCKTGCKQYIKDIGGIQ